MNEQVDIFENIENAVFKPAELKTALTKFFNFTFEQRQWTRTKFISNIREHLKAEHEDFTSAQLKLETDKYLADVYTLPNFEMMQLHLSQDTLTFMNLGFANCVWISTLFAYLTELHTLGVLN